MYWKVSMSLWHQSPDLVGDTNANPAIPVNTSMRLN